MKIRFVMDVETVQDFHFDGLDLGQGRVTLRRFCQVAEQILLAVYQDERYIKMLVILDDKHIIEAELKSLVFDRDFVVLNLDFGQSVWQGRFQQLSMQSIESDWAVAFDGVSESGYSMSVINTLAMGGESVIMFPLLDYGASNLSSDAQYMHYFPAAVQLAVVLEMMIKFVGLSLEIEEVDRTKLKSLFVAYRGKKAQKYNDANLQAVSGYTGSGPDDLQQKLPLASISGATATVSNQVIYQVGFASQYVASASLNVTNNTDEVSTGYFYIKVLLPYMEEPLFYTTVAVVLDAGQTRSFDAEMTALYLQEGAVVNMAYVCVSGLSAVDWGYSFSIACSETETGLRISGLLPEMSADELLTVVCQVLDKDWQVDSFYQVISFVPKRVFLQNDQVASITPATSKRGNLLKKIELRPTPIWTGSTSWSTVLVPVLRESNVANASRSRMNYYAEIVLLEIDMYRSLIPIVVEGTFQNLIVPEVYEGNERLQEVWEFETKTEAEHN